MTFQPPRVLVTRSEPGASRQSEALQAEGLEPIKLPVIAVEPVPCDLGEVDPDIVVVLSAHAVRYGGEAGQTWAGARWFAVGGATASELQSLGIEAVHPDIESSEGLLALAELRECAGRSIAILCGESARPLLKETLSQRGAEVIECPVYRRVPLAHVCDYHDHLLKASAVIVSSVEGLRAFAGLWRSLQGSASVILCVNSMRAQQVAKQLGFNNLRLLASQSDREVARSLADWLSGSTGQSS